MERVLIPLRCPVCGATSGFTVVGGFLKCRCGWALDLHPVRRRERREYYVYVEPERLVLSGHRTREEAERERERVEREIPGWAGKVSVYPRGHEKIAEYARTHPAWAREEGLE
jgi:hypothetical protein